MAEQQILRLGCNGLMTDPGPFAGVPDGAMVEAQNIVMRRPGVAEPRPPIALSQDTSASGTCYGAFAFDDGSSVTTQWIGSSGWRASGSSTVSGGFTFSQYATRHSSYRGRGFFTANQGIAVLDGATDTSARLAGVPRGPGFWTALSATSGWLPEDYVTGYRTVVRRSLSGIQARGAPSEVRYVANPSWSIFAGAVSVDLRVYLTPDIVAGDYVEIYRLSQVLGTVSGSFLEGYPADEGRLRDSVLITASYVSAGYFDYSDRLSDAAWDGPYLYTNASQEGILLGNERPNYARDVDVYNGMMFYAGQRSPQRVSLTLTGVGTQENTSAPPIGTSVDTQRRLIGHYFKCSTTSGSTTVTLTTAADAAYLAVGQFVTVFSGTTDYPETAAAPFAASTQIVSINAGAGTFVISAAATSNTANADARAFDYLEIDDGATARRLYVICTGSSNPPPVSAVLSTTTKTFVGTPYWHTWFVSNVSSGGACDMERAWAASYGTASFRLSAVAASKSNSDILLRIERTDASLGSFTVRSSKPLAFDRYVDSVTGVTSSQEGTPGRLAWSKIDEPESAPLPYYADIGDPNLPIYRIMAVQDALYVFKADGLWRVFGDDPQNLVIQQVDATARMTQAMSGCVSRYGNSLYAWTRRGFVECGNFGVRNIDASIYSAANTPLEGANPTYLNGWSASNWHGRWVAFSMGDGAGSSVYVFHPEMGTWSTWTFGQDITAASTPLGATNSTRNAPVFGFSGGYGLANIAWPDTTNLSAMSYLCGGDILTSAQITTANGADIIIAAGSLWTPAVGDALIGDSSGPYYVVSVASSTSFTVDRSGLTTGYPTVYDSYPVKVTWTASPAGNPASVKHFVDSVLMFSRVLQGRSLTERYQGYQNPTEATNVVTYDSDGSTFSAVKPYVRRGHVDKTVGRDWALKLGFTIQQGATFWTLDGAAVSYVFTGTRL